MLLSLSGGLAVVHKNPLPFFLSEQRFCWAHFPDSLPLDVALWSRSHQWKRHMPPGGPFFQHQTLFLHILPLPTGTQMWQGTLPKPWTWPQGPRVWQSMKTEGPCNKSDWMCPEPPYKKSLVILKLTCWRNHGMRPHGYAERSWRDPGWSGP